MSITYQDLLRSTWANHDSKGMQDNQSVLARSERDLYEMLKLVPLFGSSIGFGF